MPAGRRKPRGELAYGGNRRNGLYIKTINSGYGSLEMTGPREQGVGLFSRWASISVFSKQLLFNRINLGLTGRLSSSYSNDSVSSPHVD